ncbi:hypothetical protein COCC4DRAFT_32813 [Bipolaris maydis ATCC 48331]|uniref:Uncharacterized protein n=2 Tax=Cochliobolus heterostrophus TaxID=5016 RepID=M2UG30_COCH5|nr:uncharacterized protein COCC4DRAFT_32813 [Bipolaris maydis ATCC 48331]EMD86872.1 hypothetical protein COCHEDRAFT_1023685 [Bipolaris maydis C5]KAH7559881.1 hypothetical protein BM1_03515 [Bipolaris maydis]ENI04131.1 hypothetical protein COCC4DRAFT_32813 [Bipolaris maydis ATCC 48331]KAJ5021139.1 hypothetical protein J3E73DRAFT_354095 [Bipolaris maydis]KAJ5055571.1 hypothetical protein J3E74DRAFT_380442 [Bipolaris maydis]
MATMFRHFSFDPVPRPAHAAYEAERAAMNVSPTSPALLPHHPSRPPTPPCTMGDLALQLNHQTLRIDSPVACRSTRPPTPDSDCGSDSDSDSDRSPLPTTECVQEQPRPTYSRISASILRMQRQHTSRMQCTSSHARDISKLVQMIEAEKQCTVSPPSSSTCPPTAASARDEAVDMDYDLPAKRIEATIATSMWRASDRRESSVRVTKTVRMRKRSRENAVCK